MKITDMNWMQVEAYLKGDDRAVVPIGSTEQHAQLSLGVDLILSERVSVEAAEPLGVPVFPTINYGTTPYFTAFPGTISLRVATLIGIVRDVLDSLKRHGFRRGDSAFQTCHRTRYEFCARLRDVGAHVRRYWGVRHGRRLHSEGLRVPRPRQRL